MNEQPEVDGPAHPADPGAEATSGEKPPSIPPARGGKTTDARPGFTTETGADKD